MSLKVWLPLCGDLKNKGVKEYNITIFRGNTVFNDNGKIGKCFYANGVNTLKINNIIPDIYNYTAYSLCAWAYIETNNTSHTGSAIISGGNWNSQLLNLSMSDWSNDHYTKLRISGTNWNRTYNYNFNKNTWYHIVVCDDGNYTYAYVNGVLIGNTATSFLPTSIEGTDICIGGATYYAGMQFFGRINDVRIYNHCLSAAEVHEISQGLMTHYKLDNIYCSSVTNLLGSKSENFVGRWSSYGFGSHGQITEANIAPAISGQAALVTNKDSGNYSAEIAAWAGNSIMNTNDTLTFSAYVKGNGNTIGKTGRIHIYNTNGTNTLSQGTNFTFTNEWQRVSFTLTWTYENPSNASANCYVYCTRAQGESFYISNCQLERGNIATGFTNSSRNNNIVKDSSGYNHNGIMTNNITFTNNTPRYSNATFLNKVRINSASGFPSGENPVFTVCFWTKILSTITYVSYGDLIGFYDKDQGNNTFRLELCGSPASNNLTWFRGPSGRNGGGFNMNSSSSSGWFSKDTWHHIALVGDGINKKYYCYLDGKLCGSYNGSANTWEPTGQWYLSDTTEATAYFSDVRIYCTALSADDIFTLYHTSAKVDNKQNLHSFEFIEDQSKISITKRGQTTSNEFNEITSTKFKKDTTIETAQLIEF